jgi:probable F420-dependent oxidoreductase
MKFVVSFAFSSTGHLVDMARAADEAGFDSVAVSDHVVHPQNIKTPYPYTRDGKTRWEPFTDWPDCWVSIGAMAAATSRVRFVTGIYVLPMRNPFLVAKAVGTAAVLSHDRVALGIGAGWMKDEFELMQQPFEQRGKRMDEMIAVMRKLWGGGMVEHHGRFYDFEPLEMSPVPREEIPIYVGGLSEPALKRAAVVGDGWISDLHTIEELRGITAKLRAYRADSPRAAKPFCVIAAASDAYDLDGYRRLEDAGVTHVQTMPWIFYGGSILSLEDKCDGMKRFGDEVISQWKN